ncbi:MAG: hypothetical protein P4L53_23405 [Candidatus Obscuribacterales bacterium]|nr:hypothetical protein [Candidatus Obscuribacterales bacterium]
MFKPIIIRTSTALWLAAMSGTLLATPINAVDSNSKTAADAIKLYQQHSYKSAADAFEQIFKANKPTAENLYYAALSNQMCGQNVRAKQLFQYVVTNFPDTRSAQYAQTALKGAQTSQPAEGAFAQKSLGTASIAQRAEKPTAPAKFATMFYESNSPAARKILFVGNSLTYVNQLPIVLAALAINSNTCSELRVGEVVEGGATLEHMFNQTNAVKAITEDGPWTDVVLQDQSETPVKNSALTLQYSERFAKEIKKVHARTVFFETWSLNGQQSTQAQYHDVYMEACKSADGLFVPAGDAFALCHTEHPEIELYGDDRHPNQQGTYLAACVFYKKLFGRTPVGLPSDLSLAGIKIMTLSTSIASTLQSVALKAAGSN